MMTWTQLADTLNWSLIAVLAARVFLGVLVAWKRLTA